MTLKTEQNNCREDDVAYYNPHVSIILVIATVHLPVYRVKAITNNRIIRDTKNTLPFPNLYPTRFEIFFLGIPITRPMACEHSESVYQPAQGSRAAMYMAGLSDKHVSNLTKCQKTYKLM